MSRVQELTEAYSKTCGIIAMVIKDLGEVPSGHLYANLMDSGITLEVYQSIIDTLIKIKLVKLAPSHLLTWIGPK